MGKIAVKAEEKDNSSSATHTMLEKSSTLARKYVKRPKAKMVDAKVDSKDLRRRQEKASAINRRKSAPATRPLKTVRKSKADSAAKSAMRSVAQMNNDTPKMKTKHKPHRIALAIFCSAVTVVGLFFFIQASIPDVLIEVKAINSGIDVVRPKYIPRGYSLSNASSEKDGSITMVFAGPEDSSFTLTEEKSTWDSTALLNNYVKSNFSSDYSTIRERGITVYIDHGDAAWVNGGILYKTNSEGRRLTKEQIINLVSSL